MIIKFVKKKIKSRNDLTIQMNPSNESASNLEQKAAFDHLEKTQNDLNHEIANLSTKKEENKRFLYQKEDQIQQMEKKIKCLINFINIFYFQFL